MLRVYGEILEVVLMVRERIDAVDRRDADLGRQLRRACTSVVLNLGEGMGSTGRTRTARYRTALGSMRETTACFDVAVALGYVEPLDDEVRRRIAGVTACLVKLAAVR